MKINKATLVQMFVELGFASATGWSTDKLQTKTEALAEGVDETQEMKTPEGAKALKSILKALGAGEKIKIVDDSDEDEPKSKKASKKADADESEEEESEESEESEDEESEEDDEPKSKKPAKKSGKATRPAAGTKTGKVWDIADKLAAKGKADRAKIIEACVKAGINKSTAAVQYLAWSKTQ